MDFVFDAAKADAFLEMARRRYACKKFRKDVGLSTSAVLYLLECCRLSPSSFGLEPWHFVAVTSPERLLSLGDACFAQEAVLSSACTIAILIRRESAFKIGSAFLKARAERFPGGYAVFAEDYRAYHAFLESRGRVLEWARAQAYIACANVMTGAAGIGLDSCAIEGFDEEKVLPFLGMDASAWTVGLLVSFGQRDEEIRPKIREPIEAISEIR